MDYDTPLLPLTYIGFLKDKTDDNLERQHFLHKEVVCGNFLQQSQKLYEYTERVQFLLYE
jgi:hypothetical protein